MNTDTRTPATRRLAEFAAALRFEDLPDGVVAHVRKAALDGLGCCLVGSTLPWTRILTETVVQDGGAEVATVIGTPHKLPLSAAALINATAGHAFELDDIHRDSIIHPNSITVPVALGTAESLGGASGERVVTAIVAGYEIANRIGAAAGTDLLLRGFHPQGTGGAIAAAVTAGHLMELDAEGMLNAVGIAGSLGAGLMAAQEGAMVKRMHSGRAAEAGVRAAQLAKRGFTGIDNIVEVEYGGFLSCFAGHAKTERALAGLGTEWETPKTGFKPYATVTSIHAALDSLRAIMAAGDLKAADIKRITAKISHPTYVHCAWPYMAQSVTAAQMNLYYGLAMIALEGAAFVDQFKPERIGRLDVMDFIGRIAAEVDPEIEERGPAFRHMARLVVETEDGRVFEHEEEHRRGSPENPVSAADLMDKFRALADPVLGANGAAALADDVGRLETLPDVAPVTERLAKPA